MLAKGSRTRPRGAAVLVTVLVSVIAASIAIGLVRLVLVSSGESAGRISLDNASDAARTVREQTEATLRENPLSPYTTVLADEADRICGPTGAKVTAGSAWPANCGTTWTYDAVPASRVSWVQLVLPGPGRPALQLMAFGRSGGVTTGFVDTLISGGRSRPSVFSGAALDLATLGSTPSSVSLPGTVYSNGTLSWSGADTSASLLASEDGFAPTPSGAAPGTLASRRFAGPDPDNDAATPISAIRSWQPTPLSGAELRSSATALKTLACTGGTPVAFTTGSTRRSSSLCLSAGYAVRTSSGSNITAPAASQWLLIPNATASGTGMTSETVDVYYVTGETFAAGASNCSGCDLAAAVDDQLDPEREDGPLPPHPGFSSTWTMLGTFDLPASGVIYTDADTSFGHCGGGFRDGTCTTWGSSPQPGARVTESFTLVAGSLDSPANVYLAGPVSAGNGARPTLLATGRIIVPYWSRPAGGSLSVTADLVTLSSSSISTLPVTAPTSTSNTADGLYISGTLAGSALAVDVSPGIFASYRFSVPAGANLNAAPLSPTPRLTWILDASRRLTAADLAELLGTP